jgi:hypothetical protein
MHLLRPSFLATLLAASIAPLAAITINQSNTSFLEDFDTLATATGSVVPAGWAFVEIGSGANTTYGASNGSSTTGNTYSLGATAATERAFGALRTSSVASTLGTLVTNATGGAITNLTIQFTGEQWRLATLGRVDRLDFSYSTDATSLSDGTWLDIDALDFVAPVTAGLVGALDGNAAENQLLVSHTITGLGLLDGGSLWLRWVDFDANSSDDALAIDNFSVMAVVPGDVDPTPQSVPEQLPTSVVVVALVGLLALGTRWRAGQTQALAA